MADILDILELDRAQQSGEMAVEKKKKKSIDKPTFKKPEGMNREVFALLCSDAKDQAPLIPTDIAISSKLGFPPYGYKKAKANLGLRNARKWAWIGFTNPARKDGFQLYHWRREMDRANEYPFAKMNITNAVPTYTDTEYQELLNVPSWTKAETDCLFRLCRKFDLRFVVVADRWKSTSMPSRTIEEMKERYYNIISILAKAREKMPGVDVTSLKQQLCVFDGEHERKRKEQLNKLYKRTAEEVEEEQMLVSELRKIEHGKKERERKQQALQKLITASDQTNEPAPKGDGGTISSGVGGNIQSRASTSGGGGRGGGGVSRKSRTTFPRIRFADQAAGTATINNALESAGIKFPESKTSGVYLRSSRTKLPSSVGQKRTKAIENLLNQLGIDSHPMPTADIVQEFNDLRSDIVVVYELKTALNALEFELHTLKHRLEAQAGGAGTSLPAGSAQSAAGGAAAAATDGGVGPTADTLSDTLNVANTPGDAKATPSSGTEEPTKTISEMIDVTPGTPRKRRAAIEQVNMMRKLRKN